MSNAKKIPWYQPIVGELERELVNEVLTSNYLNDGEMTARFEREFGAMIGAKHTLAVSSGTMAMFLCLKGLDIGPGDEVIVPDLTFIATAHAVNLTGAKVVLVDIDPATLTLDPAAARAAITPRTKAIMPVHVSGRGANMVAILKLANEFNLAVVEDAAEAFMSKLGEAYLGTIGNAGCFSLSPFKIISSGQGGLITTNDTELYKKLIKLKDHGRPIKGTGGADIHESIGYNFKYTNLQAAVGIGQLNAIPFRVDRIRRTCQLYREHLKPGTVTLYPFNLEAGELPLWVDAWTEKRDELEAYLKTKNIECRKFWHPIHTQTAYQADDSLFPHSTKMSAQSIWLPSAYTSSDQDIIEVCSEINGFFGV